MSLAWLRWLDGRLRRSREVRDSSSFHAGRRVRAFIDVEPLESRVAPSHLTILGANLTSDPADHRDHATHGERGGLTVTTEIIRHAAHRVVNDAVRHPGHEVLERRGPVAFPVRTAAQPTRATTRAIVIAGLRAPQNVKSADSKRIAGFRARPMPTGSRGEAVLVQTTLSLARRVAVVAVKSRGSSGRLTPPGLPVRESGEFAAERIDATTSEVVITDPSTATAGLSLNGTLTATDDYGNTITGFGGNVTLTHGDGQPVHVVAQTAFTKGTAVFTVALDAPDTAKPLAGATTVASTNPFVIISRAAHLSPFLVSGPALA